MNMYRYIIVFIFVVSLMVVGAAAENSTNGGPQRFAHTNSVSEKSTSIITREPVPTTTHVNSVSVKTTSGTTSGPVPAIPNTNSVSNSTAVGKQLSKYWTNLQKFLQNPNILTVFQNQMGEFIKTNNVSFPISVMTPENLQKVLLLLGSGSNNLQGISQYAGLLGNFSNDLRNVTEELEQHISPQCFGHLEFLVSELLKREQWAFKMIDAAGKIHSGLFDGDMLWIGSYDECLAVHAGKFDGKHCIANLPLTNLLGSIVPMPGGVNGKMGICMPDSCTALESKVIVNTLLELVPLGQTKLQASTVECSEPEEYDDVAIAGFTVCGVFFLLMVLSTVFDMMYSQDQNQSHVTKNGVTSESKYRVNGDVKKPTKSGQPGSLFSLVYHVVRQAKMTSSCGMLVYRETTSIVTRDVSSGLLPRLAMTFSVYTNGRKLMSTEQAGGALGAINGIRFLSISWVVLGHAFSFGMDEMQNKTFTVDFMGNWSSMVVVNGLLSVDSFFTLSGLLVSYLFMREMKREKGRINWFMFYFHRFWRLTPPYMLLLFLDMSLYRYLGDGPFFPKGGVDGKFCRESWWTNILYINNLVNAERMCFGWSWYLANDMQFYVVSPILLVPLYFSKKIGVFINILALLGISIATGVVSNHYGLSPNLMSTDPAVMMESYDHYSYDYYVVPWCRMGPYIVGVVTGYIIYKTDGKFKIRKLMNLLIWLVMAVAACIVVYGIYSPVNGDQWSSGVSALYNAVHRSVWGVCVCWVIFACVTGNGGIVNDFLSWKLFVPLSRLSYCIYLTHPLVLFYYVQTLRQPFYATTLGLVNVFLASLVLSILVSIVATLAFETPMMSLEKILFRRGKK